MSSNCPGTWGNSFRCLFSQLKMLWLQSWSFLFNFINFNIGFGMLHNMFVMVFLYRPDTQNFQRVAEFSVHMKFIINCSLIKSDTILNANKIKLFYFCWVTSAYIIMWDERQIHVAGTVGVSSCFILGQSRHCWQVPEGLVASFSQTDNTQPHCWLLIAACLEHQSQWPPVPTSRILT